MSYSRKKLTGGLKTCLILCFLLYPWKFQTKQSFSPRNSTKLCYTTQKFKGLKPRPLEIVDNFFLIILGNSTSLLIKPWEILLAISSIPLESPYPQLPPILFVFFWNNSIYFLNQLYEQQTQVELWYLPNYLPGCIRVCRSSPFGG